MSTWKTDNKNHKRGETSVKRSGDLQAWSSVVESALRFPWPTNGGVRMWLVSLIYGVEIEGSTPTSKKSPPPYLDKKRAGTPADDRGREKKRRREKGEEEEDSGRTV